MTNKELRDLLEQFDDDLPVEIYQDEWCDSFDIESVTIEEVEHGDYFNRKSYKAIVLQ